MGWLGGGVASFSDDDDDSRELVLNFPPIKLAVGHRATHAYSLRDSCNFNFSLFGLSSS